MAGSTGLIRGAFLPDVDSWRMTFPERHWGSAYPGGFAGSSSTTWTTSWQGSVAESPRT